MCSEMGPRNDLGTMSEMFPPSPGVGSFKWYAKLVARKRRVWSRREPKRSLSRAAALAAAGPVAP